jgi:hypothetical protein
MDIDVALVRSPNIIMAQYIVLGYTTVLKRSLMKHIVESLATVHVYLCSIRGRLVSYGLNHKERQDAVD